MPRRTLIQGATVVLPRETARTPVLIDDGRIAAVGAAAHSRADEVVDATGLHLLPGVIDDQVHFRDPGLTHKEDLRTGSRACAAGGVTSFLEMPNTVPQTITVDALAAKLALAERRCVVNYGFYIGATTGNLAELRRASRTPGIKIFMGSSTGNMLVDDQDRASRRSLRGRLCRSRPTARTSPPCTPTPPRWTVPSPFVTTRASATTARR